MAKQKEIIPLVGTIGGINFYFRKGVAVARSAGGGFNGRAIKNKPSMIRVRENNSEFGHCSTVKKQFRIALFPFLKYYKESTLHGRMMQLFQGIKNCDTISMRGARKVGIGLLTPNGTQLFKEFLFTPKCNVNFVVPMKGSYDAVSCLYTVVDFDISLVRFPKGATHMELQFGVLGVDFDLGIYKMFMGDAIVFERNVEVAAFSLFPLLLPDAGLHRYAFLGLTFYQEINGALYVFKEDGNVGLAIVS
jgi:hypothetical protein